MFPLCFFLSVFFSHLFSPRASSRDDSTPAFSSATFRGKGEYVSRVAEADRKGGRVLHPVPILWSFFFFFFEDARERQKASRIALSEASRRPADLASPRLRALSLGLNAMKCILRPIFGDLDGRGASGFVLLATRLEQVEVLSVRRRPSSLSSSSAAALVSSPC